MRRRLLVWIFPILFLAVAEVRAGWEMVTPFGTRQDLNAVAFGNGKYVVGGAGLFLYSTNNGGRWWKGEFNGSPSIKKIAFGNDTFVAVGSGVGYRSSDGMRWEASADSVEANDLAFGNGVFVAAGNGSIAYSTNGAAWTVVSNVAPHSIRLMSFGNGKFLGVASESIHQLSTNLLIVTSSDGIKWESEVFELVTPPSDLECPPRAACRGYSVVDVAFGNGMFIATILYEIDSVGNLGLNFVVLTQDGWTPTGHATFRGVTTLTALDHLEYVNEEFIRLGDAEFTPDPLYFWTLKGALHRLPLTPSPMPLPTGVAGNGDSLVIVGEQGYIAIGPGFGPDFQTMARPAAGSLVSLVSVAANGKRLVGIGTDLISEVSTDEGATWSAIALPAGAGRLKAVKYADGKFVAVGAGGTVVRSTLGDAWSKRLSNTSSDLNDVVFNEVVWVAVGNGGTVISSADASFFELRSVPTEVALHGVTYGGQFVAVGADGAILRSNDGCGLECARDRGGGDVV